MVENRPDGITLTWIRSEYEPVELFEVSIPVHGSLLLIRRQGRNGLFDSVCPPMGLGWVDCHSGNRGWSLSWPWRSSMSNTGGISVGS